MQKEVIHQHKKLAYMIAGAKGPWLLLMHGFAELPSVFDEILPSLSEKCQVLIPFLPGTGPSERLESGSSLEDMAVAMKAVLDAEGIDKAVVAGHSMGGYIAVAFAALYPGIVNGLGLINSSAYADDEEKKETRRKGIAFMNREGVESFVSETSAKLFGKQFKAEHPDKVGDYIAAGSRLDRKSLIQYYEMMMGRPDRREQLLKKWPVLFVIGTEDPAVPLKTALEQSAMPQNAYIHVLDNTGHMSMLEMPGRTAQSLLELMHNA